MPYFILYKAHICFIFLFWETSQGQPLGFFFKMFPGIFRNILILSTQILYQAAVDKTSCVYNAVYIFLQTFKDSRNALLKKQEKHLYVSCFLLHFFRALAALQQNRAQSRHLYLLIVYYLMLPYITFLPRGIFGWKSSAVALKRSFCSLYHGSVQLNFAILYQTQLPKSLPILKLLS